jgi:hypothetical protein
MTTSRPETEPSLTIPGVPESITRAQYLALLEPLGLNLYDLVHLEFGVNGIVAEVKARNAEGKHYVSPTERNTLARHSIVIPVKD